MIIKKIKINSFGGLKNIEMSFHKGVNLVYGNNEAGKSTTEAFIKIMLYGFGKKKINGESERIKYMPFDSNIMSGEILLEHNKIDYIIKRSFGNTKKEDKSQIINAFNGEEVNEISKEEPGKYFLGINRTTFEKTLFVSQLGVKITKDKEEEIMDKITTIFGCGEEEVPVAKAIETLNAIKKNLTTIRGAGELDLLKKKEQELIQELYEANNICEKNLKWEEELYLKNNERKILEEEITKLDVYKKYLKKINLQKEYREIAEYLKKSEDLKKKEKEIRLDIVKGNEVIDENFLDSLKEDNIQYINLSQKIDEMDSEKNILFDEINSYKEQISKYEFINKFENNIIDKLMNLKYEQRMLKEKISIAQKIMLDINKYEKELKEAKKLNEDIIPIKDIKENIEYDFREYEKLLYRIKSLAEKRNIDKDLNVVMKLENIKTLVSIVLILISIGGIVLGFPLNILGIILLLASGFYLFKCIESRRKVKEIFYLSEEVNKIEDKLNGYMSIAKVSSYIELLNALKKYNNYSEEEEKIGLTIKEKKNLLSENDYISISDTFKKNEVFIDKLLKLSNCSNIDELIEKINEVDKIKLKLHSLEVDYIGKEKNIKITKGTLSDKENEIRRKLKVINLENIELINLDRYINEYNIKIKRYREINSNLNSIEETYKALLKDRDIEFIKEDLKDIIQDENQYAYTSEEDIEIEEKKRIKELLECEKRIKDLENNIKNRLIGKRDLVEVEEELQYVKEEIEKGNKKVKALDLSLKVLIESLNEVRKEIGPVINQKILENFSLLTNKKYNEVLLNDNYEMMVRDKRNLFKGSFLSNGAIDQLYLALRVALIQLLYPQEECIVILDDALVQYDDERRKHALLMLIEKINGQLIIFTCQNIESKILKNEGIEAKYLLL